MGVVYEAEQQSLSRRVALKVLALAPGQSPEAVERFRREARAVARLHHTHIVPVFEVGQQDGAWFYAMQYIDGEPLDAVLRQLRQLRGHTPATPPGGASPGGPLPPSGSHVGPLAHTLWNASSWHFAPTVIVDDGRNDLSDAATPTPHSDASWSRPREVTAHWTSRESSPADNAPRPADERPIALSEVLPDSGGDDARFREDGRTVARVGAEVAEALAYAHGQGIVHRDVKPSNLLLDRQGRAWVTDFGLAKIEGDDLTHSGGLVGTLRFMAPERFRGETDPRSDVYSLGATLYELLTLRPAFGETDRVRLMAAISLESPRRLRQIDPRIPRDLETIVLKALEKEPAHRYSSAEDLAADLRRFLDDRPIAARRASYVEQFWRWCRRNPLVASLLALLLVVFAAGFAGVTTQWIRAEHHAEKEAEVRGQAEHQATLARQAAERESQARESAQEAERRTRRLLYVAHMNLAQQAWEQANIPRVRELLAAHVPKPGERDPRGFEWYHWWKTAHPPQRTFQYGAQITGFALSPDGARLAAGGPGKEIVVWDAASGEVLRTFPLKGWVRLAFSSKGLLAAADQLGTLRVLDTETGETLATRASAHDGSIQCLAFSPDGETLATGATDGALKLWEVPGLAPLADPPDSHKPFVSHEWITALAYTPDGKSLAVSYGGWGASEAGSLLVDLRTRKRERLETGSATSWALAVSPDGARLAATGLDTMLSVLKGPEWKPERSLKAHEDVGVAVAWSPDSRLVATAGFDRLIKVWSAGDGRLVATLRGHGNSVLHLAFSPDGRRLYSSSEDGSIVAWEEFRRDVPEVVAAHAKDVWGVAPLPGGERVISAAGDGTIRVRDLRDGSLQDLIMVTGGEVGAFAAAPDGDRVALGTMTGRVSVWDVARRARVLQLDRHGERIWGLAFSPDSRILASGSEDGTVRLWSATDGRPLRVLEGHPSWVRGVAFAPDGRTLASTCNDGKVRLWETDMGRLVGVLEGHTREVRAVAFSRDGRRLASAGEDTSVIVWDLDTRARLHDLTGHASHITSLAFSADGRTLVSGSNDRTVRLWDLVTGELKTTLRTHPGNVLCVALTPDETTLVAGDHAGNFHLWRAAPRESAGADGE